MMSLPFHRAFLWFREGANQWERGMLDYFGEGLMPGGFTFTRCQVARATSVSCTSWSSRTPVRLPASAASLPTEQPWEGSSGPEGLWPLLMVIATDLWVPGKRILCCLFFSGVDWGLDRYWLVAASLWDGKEQWNLRKPIISKMSSDSHYLNCTLNFWVAGRNPSSYGTKTGEGEDSRGWEAF